MKSMPIEKAIFSMEDFEKGLMLAGYLMPRSVSEFNEREALQKYEGESRGNARSVYFKRVVLAAEIVSKLHEEPTMGRIKFQKLVYLCEHAADMRLEGRYAKQAAGPFDNKFMHSIEKEFKSNKWFSVLKIKVGNITRSKYVPLENSVGYKKYYDNYFADEDSKIQSLIELFRKKSTDHTELAVTVFACHHELFMKTKEFDSGDLISLFYDWSEKKQRFKQEEILNSYQWLQDIGIIVAR